MMRFLPAIAVLFLTKSPTAVQAKCSADNCGDCLRDSDCHWWSEANGYCEEGCGMHGCGASVCASDIDNCVDCLGDESTDASSQYAWSPFSGNTGECVDTCMDAPADAPCYQAKSAAYPGQGYDPSICEDISVCRSKNSCTECLQDGACAWSEGSCYDSCMDYDVPQDTSCFEGKQYDPVDVCDDAPPPETRECVPDDRPRPVRNGQRYRFNLVKSDAQCVDGSKRLYEFGQFSDVRDFSDCAEKCVNDTPSTLATNSGFRGIDFDCQRSHCRCLYDEGTLDNRNSGRFDRTNRNNPGDGSISGGTKKTDYYCGKLVGAEFLDEMLAEA